MAFPSRTLRAVCEISSGTLQISQRPPAYTHEAGALSVVVDLKNNGAAYVPDASIVAGMYLFWPDTQYMSEFVEMNIVGCTLSGSFGDALTAMPGCPLLVVQLQDTETTNIIVAAAAPIQITKVEGSLIVTTRPPSPSEIIYVGRSPYINMDNLHWIQWDNDIRAYVDTGVVAQGPVAKVCGVSPDALGNVPLTKADVGLGNVDNTSDANKPISTAAQTALDGKVPTTRTVNGHALSANVEITKTDVGLGNVDNTSDANKPISTAAQTALDGKVPTTRTVNGHALSENITVSKADVGLGNVDNTSDANKPISTATQTALGGLDNMIDIHSTQIAYLYSLHMDGTAATYKKLMKEFFDAHNANAMTPAELTQLCSDWYEGIRGNWNGYTEFYQPSVSDASTGTRGGDNASMICEASTDAVAGRDDFAGLPLFAPTDVNWEIDATTLEPIITGIDGITTSFERNNPAKLVGVMQMTGWHWMDDDAEAFKEGYSEQYQSGHDYCEPLPEAVKTSDNTMRQFVVHAKYQGRIVDGKMRCYAGAIPTAWQSHNTLQTNSKANGSQYGGGSVLLQSFLTLMTRIKYASLTLDGIIQGCLAYNYQYYAATAETGVKRILITPAQAANLDVGSGVLVGTVGANNNVDRNTASVYSISGQKGSIITAIEEVEIDGTTYTAVYVDTDNTFDTTGDGTKTTGNTMISTFHWPCGTNDAVLGNDGSIGSATSGKYPAKLQGIEFINGSYEVFGDVILADDPADTDHQYGVYKAYTVNRSANQATSITANYSDIGVIQPKEASAAAWRYIVHEKLGAGGVYMADNVNGGSSTKYTKDAFYQTAPVTTRGLREWLAFAYLDHGSDFGGLSCVVGNLALANAYWHLGGRPSACANRGVWGASPQ